MGEQGLLCPLVSPMPGKQPARERVCTHTKQSLNKRIHLPEQKDSFTQDCPTVSSLENNNSNNNNNRTSLLSTVAL